MYFKSLAWTEVIPDVAPLCFSIRQAFNFRSIVVRDFKCINLDNILDIWGRCAKGVQLKQR